MAKSTIGLWMYRNDGGAGILQRLCERLEALGHRVVSDFDMRQCHVLNGRVYTPDGVSLSDLDVLYHMNADEQNDHQGEVLRSLELSGVDVINGWSGYSMCKDKFIANAILRQHGIRVPPAALVPSSVTRDFIDTLFEEWRSVLVKPRGNHGAVGIQLFDHAERLWDYVLATRHLLGSYYLEKFFEFGDYDYRVEVFDGQVIGGYSRGKRHRFKTNVTGGGAMLPIPPTAERQQLALRAAAILGITATIVDMIEAKEDGHTYVLEVNPIMGIFVEAGMRAGTKMPITEPHPTYSNDDQKLEHLVSYLDRACQQARERSRARP